MQSGKHQLLLIELVRFLAALSVLVWHYQHFTYVHYQPARLVVSSQPFYSLLWPVYERGLLGVQVFWAVSGFIFFWKYKAPLASRLVHARAFFVLRFSRLYPLHLFTLGVMVLLVAFYRFAALMNRIDQVADTLHLMSHERERLHRAAAIDAGYNIGRL